ncbi:MAG TPA: hypothetical protein VFE82_02770 [Ramlibacter sp.]|jgi:hypothetical protein|uniref:hypothetical protein n=1 Tax=Ramlibacter sp. TaxID=1917967 RepID=UPI002D717715|nr:hypothetical protein [Ramlibacter sp.]HZY17372.1 hypothetical protein [Ramlibacter sp.]
MLLLALVRHAWKRLLAALPARVLAQLDALAERRALARAERRRRLLQAARSRG